MTTTIRCVEDRDVAAVHQIFLSEPVLMGTMRLPIQSPDYTAKRLARTDDAHKMVAEIDGAILGYAELLTSPFAPRHAHAGELNMIVSHPGHRGKGIASSLMEAVTDLGDNWLNLRRIQLTVWVDNSRAIALYERFGFEQEGVLRDYVYRKGAYIDGIIMSRLRRG